MSWAAVEAELVAIYCFAVSVFNKNGRRDGCVSCVYH